jgi:hypothetical protein
MSGWLTTGNGASFDIGAIGADSTGAFTAGKGGSRFGSSRVKSSAKSLSISSSFIGDAAGTTSGVSTSLELDGTDGCDGLAGLDGRITGFFFPKVACQY